MTYDIILADPPWNFRVWSPTKSARWTGHKYDLMRQEDICNLPVPSLLAKNSALFLWSIWPMLPHALQVIQAWGFTYRTVAWVWVKSKRSGTGFHMGMGFYTRANTEPCLLAVKGSMPVAVHNEPALIYSPVRGHSEKPDEQYDKIEALYPGMRYLEMFARHRRPGWDAWGNGIVTGISLEGARL